MAPEPFKEFCEEFHRELNRRRVGESAARDATRGELERTERRIRRIVSVITEDDAPMRALKEELVSLEAHQLTLRGDSLPQMWRRY